MRGSMVEGKCSSSRERGTLGPRYLRGDIEAPEFRARLLFLEHAREATLAAAHVQHAAAGEIAQMIADQLDVIDARIDGGGKMLLVARGFVERGLNAGAQLRGELRAWFSGKPSGKEPLPVQFEAF